MKPFSTALFTLCALTAVAATKSTSISFKPGGWDRRNFIMVKSPRFTYLGKWIQKSDYIENSVAPGAKLKKGVMSSKYTYTSMVLREPIGGKVTIRCKMSFLQRMAPLLVIAPELGKDKNGTAEYKDHYEIVLYDLGVNIWRHKMIDGKPWWIKTAFLKKKFAPNKVHELTMQLRPTKKGTLITIKIGDSEFGATVPLLPEKYYIGITACEGVNRFYSLQVASKTK
jgi:hypothetical protein